MANFENMFSQAMGKMTPDQLQQFLKQLDTAMLNPTSNTTAGSRGQARARQLATAGSGPSQDYQLKQMQLAMLQDQLNQARAARQTTGGGMIGRSANAMGGGGASQVWGRPYGNDMLQPPRMSLADRKKREEMEKYTKDWRDTELALLKDRLEDAMRKRELEREMFEEEARLADRSDRRKQSTFSQRRKSLMEMFG